MNKFFAILFCFFLASCQAVKYQPSGGYSSKITFEAFEETRQCNGEGIVFKAVKSKNGTYYAVKKSPFYLEPGTYEFVYNKARQVIGETGYCTTEEEIWVRVHCNECRYVEYGYTTVNLMPNTSYLLTKYGELKKL
jgi:hypothetical protein